MRTPADIRRSAEIAAAYGQALVVVVSAFYGVTDTISRALKEALISLEAIKGRVDELRKLHHAAIDAHIGAANASLKLRETIDARLEELYRTLKGIHYIDAVPDFTRDRALSYGERLSSPIVTAVLNAAGLEATEALPELIGLMTDGRFGNASADMAFCEGALKDSFTEDHSYVVPGFYGTTPEGATAIFGRGGSDYTAAVIARCIGGKSLDLWKDVDGFLSSDPRINPDSRTIPRLSYAEAAELAYFGAKVLHPRTVEPLEDTAIPIRVMNVNKFEGSVEPYSIVGPESAPSAAGPAAEVPAAAEDPEHKRPVIKSVSAAENMGIIRIEGPGVGSRPGILARATGRLDAAGVNISSVITAQTCINLIFKGEDLAKALAVLRAESIGGVIAVEAVEDCALVAAVGAGIRDSVGVGSRVLGALAEENINVILAQAGASPVAVYMLVRREDRERAVTAIHRRMGRFHEGN